MVTFMGAVPRILACAQPNPRYESEHARLVEPRRTGPTHDPLVGRERGPDYVDHQCGVY